MRQRQIILTLACTVLVATNAVKSGLAASVSEFPFNLPWGTSHPVAKELIPLSNHDVSLIIDKSRSMSIADCFPARMDNIAHQFYPPLSRWQWCHEQTSQLTKKTEKVLSNGLTIVLFAKTFATYNNANIRTIETIFTDNKPEGGTDTASALSSQIEDYFSRKSKSAENTKPLLIAIISDGCPNDPASFFKVIIDATQKMTSANEISITFLQVGNDHRSIYLFKQLKNGLLDQNAKFNIVNIIPFPELNKIGLAQALIDITTPHSLSQK